MRLSHRSPSALGVGLVAAAVLVACGEQAREPAPAETATVAPAPPLQQPSRPPPGPPAWDSSFGPVIAVRGSSPSEVQVILPHVTDSTLASMTRLDTAGLGGHALDLFTHSGRAGQLRLGAVDNRGTVAECPSWPRAAAAPLGGSDAPPNWSVAFVAGRAEPIPLDSIEGLPAADSARLAAEVTRLASALPHDTALAFRGVPFVVRRAYRFSPAQGVDAVAAEVVRAVNQEANPLREHILPVAERASKEAGRRYHTVYSERASGVEERVPTTEVLAALRLGPPPRRAALVLVRAGEVSAAYALLERTRRGRWRVRWTSAYTGC